MKLDNFKELLAKKASGNENLQLFIKYMKDDMLADHVIESLSKMAEIDQKRVPNESVVSFGRNMEPDDVDMIYDALSHHGSQYKAALNAGNEKLADKHMKNIFNIMYLSRKMKDQYDDLTGGKLKIDAIDVKPWERSKYQSKNDAGKFKTDTQGWKRSSNDYSWLRGAPHDSYGKEIAVHGNKGAYPIEQIKVNGKFIDIDDNVEPTDQFIPHAFDSHPILNTFKIPKSKFNSEAHKNYINNTIKFNRSAEILDPYYDKIESMDPERLKNRGLEAAKAIHKELLGGDDAMKRLAEITGKSPEELSPAKTEAESAQPEAPKAVEAQPAGSVADTATEAAPQQTPAPAPKVSAPQEQAPAPSAPAEQQISGDEAMKRLKQIMGNKFKG